VHVKHLTISGRANGGMGAPATGIVVFSDGRAYEWFTLIEHDPISGTYKHMGQYRFAGARKAPGGGYALRVTFASRPREVALIEALAGN
jgi:hypothetical protein